MIKLVEDDNVYDDLNEGSAKLIKVIDAFVVYDNDFDQPEDYQSALSNYYKDIQSLLYDVKHNTYFSGDINDYGCLRENTNDIFTSQFLNTNYEAATDDEMELYSEGKIDLIEATLYISIEILKYCDPNKDDIKSFGIKVM